MSMDIQTIIHQNLYIFRRRFCLYTKFSKNVLKNFQKGTRHHRVSNKQLKKLLSPPKLPSYIIRRFLIRIQPLFHGNRNRIDRTEFSLSLPLRQGVANHKSICFSYFLFDAADLASFNRLFRQLCHRPFFFRQIIYGKIITQEIITNIKKIGFVCFMSHNSTDFLSDNILVHSKNSCQHS